MKENYFIYAFKNIAGFTAACLTTLKNTAGIT
jgi:hypothetical protein